MDTFLQSIIAAHRDHWPEEFDPVLLPFTLTLHRAHGVMYGRACGVMERFGLSPAEFDVLASLRRSPEPYELTPSQLRQALLITSGGLTKVLHQLAGRGLIVRLTVSGDRRVKPVRLAPAALPLIGRAMEAVMRHAGAQIFAHLTPEEIQSMTGLLARLAGDEGGSMGGSPG
ncbi:MAG: MarR family transcriptional regulator [Magnetococcales bacterium]|nr:MarR family transcriptional regulator [Magnetococcales bacterium]